MSDDAPTPPEAPPAAGEWNAVARCDEVPPGTVREVVVGDAIVAIANVAGDLHAFDGMCAHQGGPLAEGALEGCVLTCPWHGWQYDVTTGAQLLSDRVRQRRYPVAVSGDTIWLGIGERT